jgi:hypothetical protein
VKAALDIWYRATIHGRGYLVLGSISPSHIWYRATIHGQIPNTREYYWSDESRQKKGYLKVGFGYGRRRAIRLSPFQHPKGDCSKRVPTGIHPFPVSLIRLRCIIEAGEV